MTVVDSAYVAALDVWRAEAEASLRAEDGWLALAGLYWLQAGANRFGSDPANEVVLAADAPGVLGSFIYQDGHVALVPADATALLVNGAPAQRQVLRSSADGTPDLLTIGNLTLFVHRSGARYAIRVRDRSNPARKDFTGRRWFPVNEEYRVCAQFVPYDPPKPLEIPNIVGDTNQALSPGYVLFTINGQDQRLDISELRASGLWLHFHDTTGGKATYPGGRFLSTSLPVDGHVVLDFNQAVSPPCAFTPFATCPVVLPQNKLPVPIPAGEQWSGVHA